MKPNFPVYDHDQAERGWAKMLDLFTRTLGKDHDGYLPQVEDIV